MSPQAMKTALTETLTELNRHLKNAPDMNSLCKLANAQANIVSVILCIDEQTKPKGVHLTPKSSTQ